MVTGSRSNTGGPFLVCVCLTRRGSEWGEGCWEVALSSSVESLWLECTLATVG